VVSWLVLACQSATLFVQVINSRVRPNSHAPHEKVLLHTQSTCMLHLDLVALTLTVPLIHSHSQAPNYSCSLLTQFTRRLYPELYNASPIWLHKLKMQATLKVSINMYNISRQLILHPPLHQRCSNPIRHRTGSSLIIIEHNLGSC
jgi:hypothetical protein